MTSSPDEKMREAIIEQAAAWQARHLSGELSSSEKIDFLRWLQDNPSNVREYLLNGRIARLLPRRCRLHAGAVRQFLTKLAT